MATPTLPGVKVGPLDPDATESFGRVAQGNTARQLIRLHRQLFPPHLVRALARPLDVSHTKAVRENLDEVRGHLSGLERENGDPLVPENAEVIDAAVRGDRQTGQVLTFQFRQPSGRIGKSYTDYAEEHLPESFATGQDYRRIQEMKDRGVVAYDSEGTQTEILRRRLSASEAENARLREDRGAEDGGPTPAAEDARAIATDLEEREQLRRENQEMREQLAKYVALEQAQAGGVPTAGVAEELGEGPRPADASTAAQDPPFEGYDEVRADELVKRVKAEETSEDDVRAILEYERTHNARRSVVSAAEQRLDRE